MKTRAFIYSVNMGLTPSLPHGESEYLNPQPKSPTRYLRARKWFRVRDLRVQQPRFQSQLSFTIFVMLGK